MAIFDTAATESLALQAKWLDRNLEYHLLANHLWANAKALLFAGTFFDDAAAEAWITRGTRLLLRELREQVLADGGHYERSPMYHAIILEDVLDLIQLIEGAPRLFPQGLRDALYDVAPRMLRWLRAMSHPDGEISFFNDAAFKIAPTVAALERYAAALGVVEATRLRSVVWLKESGYVRLSNDRVVLICDVSPIGPDYQPGHSHADTLSFEMSLDQRRLFVNSGTSSYDRGALRSWQRSTAAHNTVVINQENSSDVWAAFRVGRRARTFDIAVEESLGGGRVTAAHDGYRRFLGGAVHKREWRLLQDRLVIEDVAEGDRESMEANFYLAPGLSSMQVPTMHFEGAETVCEVDSEWYPEFGLRIPNMRVKVSVAGNRLKTEVRWA